MASEKASEGDREDNKDNENNGWDQTPLAEGAAVAKVIARSLGEREAEARPEMGLSDNK